VLGPGERAQESPEYYLEAVLRVLKEEVRNVRLFSYDELDFRDEVHDELTIRPHRLLKQGTPTGEFRIALA